MRKNNFQVIASVCIDGEHQNHWNITKYMCKRKLRRYLRYILKYKADNFKMIMLHIWRCDLNGDMINNEYVRFVFKKQDISKTY